MINKNISPNRIKLGLYSLLVFLISSCYSNNGIYDKCYEAPFTASEKKLKQEISKKYKFGVFITRTNFNRIGSKTLCENSENSYCIHLQKFDTLYSENQIVELSLLMANRIYNEILSDTMKCIVEKIEVSFYYKIDNPKVSQNRIEEEYCFVFSKKSLEQYFGEAFEFKSGRVKRRKIDKCKKLNFISGECFYMN